MPVDLERADTLTWQGCYECLVEARDIYRRALSVSGSGVIAQSLFESELLLGLRAGEVGMANDSAFVRAASLYDALPDGYDAGRLLRLAAAVPPDALATPEAALAAHNARFGDVSATLDTQLAWLRSTAAGPALKQYLGVALRCGLDPDLGVMTVDRNVEDPPIDSARMSSPLLTYRRAACTPRDGATARALLLTDERLVAAGYQMAIAGVADVPNTGGAEELTVLELAQRRLPRAVGPRYLAAVIEKEVGDCANAIRSFQAALLLAPNHEQAQLGRTICLAREAQHERAIQSASVLLSDSTSVQRDAFYWRAVSLHALGRLDSARADIEAAREIEVNAEVLTMAGIIRFDQKDLAGSEWDLKAALAHPPHDRNCTAHFYLGRVEAGVERWRESSSSFERAMRCYDAQSSIERRRLANIRNDTSMDANYRARLTVTLESALARTRSSYFAASFNVANYAARSGDPARARRFVAIAAADTTLASVVSQLRAALGDTLSTAGDRPRVHR